MEDYGNVSYDTCAETYSTLRIFSDDLTPNQISAAVEIKSTLHFGKGDLHGQGRLQRKTNGWFFSTEESCKSRDGRLHLDLILAALDGKIEAVEALRQRGCEIDIVSYWVSTGQGGPWLMPRQMLLLGRLGIEVWWDIYFREEDET